MIFHENHIIPWHDLLKLFPGIKISKLFTSVSPGKIIKLTEKARSSDSKYAPADFLAYYVISCSDEINTAKLSRLLLRYKSTELAYVQHTPVYPPSAKANDYLHKYQAYLNPSPVGINARYAWNMSGGDGDGNVKFIDIEQGWMLQHESFVLNTLPCTGINNYSFQDHGTAVLGIIMMQPNAKRGRGITPKANGYVISQWRPDGSLNNADAIMAATSHLGFGDIILLEAQVSDSAKSDKLWPVEIQDATFQAIRLAAALGIIVIEAAGNGFNLTAGNNLDLFAINGKRIFNPESPDFKDSGAIMVAAASSASPHIRSNYSNYGNRINCYAWGENVMTAGSYPGSSGSAINTYTGNFSGTSSAAAIIAGAAIAVQSIAVANLNFRLSPIQMRNILSNDLYGTPSANKRSIDKIGVMPDLKKIIDKALKCKKNLKYSQKYQVTN